MIRLAVNGAAGRMGRSVIALAFYDDRFEIRAATEKEDHPQIGTDCGVPAGIGESGVLISETAGDFDVIIDFSDPEGLLTAIELALKNSAAIVTGTTGLDEKHLARLTEVSGKIGVFRASNFSRGIAAVTEIARKLASAFPGADIEIVEAHHRNKIDSPSGTALTIGKNIAEVRGKKLDDIMTSGRKGRTGPRPSGQIGFHSVRGGDIIGEHKVIFGLPYETVIIEHRAISRELFAAGALEAAAFIHGKTGYFDMEDLILSS
ncbi:4-hydroxy-tetrahydrodipicolinate reductase [bacterium]|nr:MAG: 4-hydroxy-tetrahydrodipicolinate reductase [bacterium]